MVLNEKELEKLNITSEDIKKMIGEGKRYTELNDYRLKKFDSFF